MLRKNHQTGGNTLVPQGGDKERDGRTRPARSWPDVADKVHRNRQPLSGTITVRLGGRRSEAQSPLPSICAGGNGA